MGAPRSSPRDPDDDQKRAAAAAALSSSLPRMAMEARRLSASVSLGLHGRGRAGVGESFWQYRALRTGETQTRIDWRKSARHAETLFVRDHEWEAARTFHIFIDCSQSMNYSSGKQPKKIDHAVIIGLALADLLVRAGERVALMGETQPTASRQIIDRMAEALVHSYDDEKALPVPLPLPKQAHLILIGDFLIDPQAIETTLAKFHHDDLSKTMLRILDPAEITFPFSGEAELVSAESTVALDIGDAIGFAAKARAQLADHERTLQELAKTHHVFFTTHRTDEPMTKSLLTLMAHVAHRKDRGAHRAHG